MGKKSHHGQKNEYTDPDPDPTAATRSFSDDDDHSELIVEQNSTSIAMVARCVISTQSSIMTDEYSEENHDSVKSTDNKTMNMEPGKSLQTRDHDTSPEEAEAEAEAETDAQIERLRMKILAKDIELTAKKKLLDSMEEEFAWKEDAWKSKEKELIRKMKAAVERADELSIWNFLSNDNVDPNGPWPLIDIANEDDQGVPTIDDIVDSLDKNSLDKI